ncbi:MAG: aminotransferase class V-fold PLP-dependent enzyme [Pseudobdellovibrionaceae bacterium]
MRNLFQYPENLTYLNSGSMALSPTVVRNRIQAERNILENNPTDALFGAWGRMWEQQKQLGQFFKADPRHLFLRSNVTIVMNDFLMALKLPPGSEILTSDIEYGAIVKICQHKALTEGHQVRFFSLHDMGQDPETVTEEQLLKRLEQSLTPKTKLVMLSHVMTGSGLTLPIEKMAKLLRSQNIFFAVDGAHGAGARILDFSNTEIDFYGTNLHKWLMGPKGTGFGFVAPRLREHLEPRFAGWTTHQIDPHFAVFGDGDAWACRWMICSTHNFSDFYGISETLKFWKDQGADKIMSRQTELLNFAKKEVSARTGWKCLSQFTTPELCGPLAAFELPSHLKALGFELMLGLQAKEKVVVSMSMIQHEWTLRISPHVYNEKTEIEKTADLLARLPNR